MGCRWGFQLYSVLFHCWQEILLHDVVIPTLQSISRDPEPEVRKVAVETLVYIAEHCSPHWISTLVDIINQVGGRSVSKGQVYPMGNHGYHIHRWPTFVLLMTTAPPQSAGWLVVLEGGLGEDNKTPRWHYLDLWASSKWVMVVTCQSLAKSF